MTEPRILTVRDCGSIGPYRNLLLDTPRGPVEVRYSDAPEANGAILMVGGAGGGFDSPARNLYDALATDMVYQGWSALRVRFREIDLGEAVHDILTGIRFLVGRGALHVGLVGHSFGAAAVIQAGAMAPEVSGVVALATQSQGTEPAAQLTPRPLLLIHGARDEVLPVGCSEYVYRVAGDPKELVILPDSGHLLDEDADRVFTLVRDFLRDGLVITPGITDFPAPVR